MLVAAKNGGEAEWVAQVEEHLAQLRALQQAERPLAARYQSAVDRASVKKAAYAQAQEAVAAIKSQLQEAEQALQTAETATKEADQALAELQQLMGEGVAAASSAGPAAPAAEGTVAGVAAALRSVVAGASPGRFSPAVAQALEAAFSSLQSAVAQDTAQAPPAGGGLPLLRCRRRLWRASPAKGQNRAPRGAGRLRRRRSEAIASGLHQLSCAQGVPHRPILSKGQFLVGRPRVRQSSRVGSDGPWFWRCGGDSVECRGSA